MSSSSLKRKNNNNQNNDEKSKKRKTRTDSEDLGRLYGDILIRAARTSFHDDSACFYDVCRSYTTTIGVWKYIFQPTKSMMERDDPVVSIIITRVDKEKITRKMFQKALPYFKKVEDLFVESFNDIIKFTNGRWSEKVDGSFEQIARIRQPLYIDEDKGILKMKYEIRGDFERCDDWWYPTRLYHWLGKDISTLPFDEHGKLKGAVEDNGLPSAYYYMTIKL